MADFQINFLPKLISYGCWFKLGGFNKQKLFILSQFWRPVVQRHFHWVEIRISAGPYSLPFPASGGYSAWLVTTSPQFLARRSQWLPFFSVCLIPPAPLSQAYM